MGKGDRRTKRGKIFNNSNGIARPKKKGTGKTMKQKPKKEAAASS